jgi:hypothetical protein
LIQFYTWKARSYQVCAPNLWVQHIAAPWPTQQLNFLTIWKLNFPTVNYSELCDKLWKVKIGGHDTILVAEKEKRKWQQCMLHS